MNSESKVSTSNGYHWRDELVNKLLPFVKEGIDRKFLNNLVRGYVPTFFVTKMPDNSKGATWLSSLSLRPDRYWWKKEVETIGKEFAQTSGLNDRLVKEIFKKYNWEVDKPVEGISIKDKRGRWKYDAFKDRTAVEVELSGRSQVFKDAFKFLIGQAMNQIDAGIIMIRHRREGKGKPYFGHVDIESHPIYATLPMLKVAFYGFPNDV